MKNVEIEVSDFTIIIGEQASGKSVTSKVYYFTREVISNELAKSIMETAGFRGFQSAIKKHFSVIFPEYSWKDSEFSISLDRVPGETLITITNHPKGAGLKFAFSDSFKQYHKKLVNTFKQFKLEQEKEIESGNNSSNYEMSFSSLFFQTVHQTNSKFLFENVIYIPSGRSFFSTIKDNVFGFLSENIGIDPFLKNFGKSYENAKRSLTRISPIREKKNKIGFARFDKISASILKGRFESQKQEDWIVSENRKISVSNASSGQQEALPLMLVLKNLIDRISSIREQAIVIEEPEAHLFPVSQKAIVELIFLIKEYRKDAKLLITTHSPYVLACVNNGILKYQGSVEVKAYFISNGISSPIIDQNTGIIDGEELDKVSSDISNEFYAAMEKF